MDNTSLPHSSQLAAEEAAGPHSAALEDHRRLRSKTCPDLSRDSEIDLERVAAACDLESHAPAQKKAAIEQEGTQKKGVL